MQVVKQDMVVFVLSLLNILEYRQIRITLREVSCWAGHGWVTVVECSNGKLALNGCREVAGEEGVGANATCDDKDEDDSGVGVRGR